MFGAKGCLRNVPLNFVSERCNLASYTFILEHKWNSLFLIHNLSWDSKLALAIIEREIIVVGKLLISNVALRNLFIFLSLVVIEKLLNVV